MKNRVVNTHNLKEENIMFNGIEDIFKHGMNKWVRYIFNNNNYNNEEYARNIIKSINIIKRCYLNNEDVVERSFTINKLFGRDKSRVIQRFFKVVPNIQPIAKRWNNEDIHEFIIRFFEHLRWYLHENNVFKRDELIYFNVEDENNNSDYEENIKQPLNKNNIIELFGEDEDEDELNFTNDEILDSLFDEDNNNNNNYQDKSLSLINGRYLDSPMRQNIKRKINEYEFLSLKNEIQKDNHRLLKRIKGNQDEKGLKDLVYKILDNVSTMVQSMERSN